ncbi:MAG: response regulator [Ignavibacteriales bacterium]|nr:response regulator [Ignavibacteriales bacterium]
MRQSLYEQFTNEDFVVDVADDGDVALEKIKQLDYDIVLLDMKMRRMNGLAVLKEMQKVHKHPRVIMLTVMRDISTALECIKLGANDYITKPYDPEELLSVVIKVLSV